MKRNIPLIILLIFLITADIITLFPWGSTIFFMGLGIPGFGLTIWLLFLHILSLKKVMKNLPIKKTYLVQQMISGFLLILLIGFIINFLSFEGDLTPKSSTETLSSIAFVLVPSVIVYFLNFYLSSLHNSRLQRGSSEQPITIQPKQNTNFNK